MSCHHSTWASLHSYGHGWSVLVVQAELRKTNQFSALPMDVDEAWGVPEVKGDPKPMGFNTKIVYENLEWLGGSPILGHLRICWAEVGDWNFHKFANILCHWNPLKYGHVWPCIQCGWYMKASASLLSPFRPGGRAFYRDAAARSRKRSPSMKRKRYEFEGKDLSGSYLTYIYLYNLL